MSDASVQVEREEWRIRPGASPTHVRAVMARRGLMLDQLLPYHDPEHGYVNPLDAPEMKASVRVFMSDLDYWLRAASGDSDPISLDSGSEA